MNPAVCYSLVGAAVFAIGLFGLIVRADAIRKILAANLMGSGVFLLLIALPYREEAPADPVPRALVLTGIVVAVSATALGLALVRRVQAVGPVAPDDQPGE
jgi:multicomponent Na+:H+ antiporter subunit C